MKKYVLTEEGLNKLIEKVVCNIHKKTDKKGIPSSSIIDSVTDTIKTFLNKKCLENSEIKKDESVAAWKLNYKKLSREELIEIFERIDKNNNISYVSEYLRWYNDNMIIGTPMEFPIEMKIRLANMFYHYVESMKEDNWMEKHTVKNE